MRALGEHGRWAIIAEGIGTAVLVTAGAGVVCLGEATKGPMGVLGLALASGLILCLLLATLGPVSGSCLNPAVTVAAVVTGRLPARLGAAYVAAQMVGAAVAGMGLRMLFPVALRTVNLGAPTLSAGVSEGLAVGLEAFVAFAWVLAVGLTCWSDTSAKLGPAIVGAVYGTSVLIVGRFSGGVGNPAHAFGPCFAAGTYEQHLVFWVGPVLGACVAALVLLALSALRPDKAPKALPPVAEPEVLDARGHYREGVELYRDGKLEAAAQAFSDATTCAPSWAEPYYYIGMVYRDFGDELNANAFFNAALYYRSAHRKQDERKMNGDG